MSPRVAAQIFQLTLLLLMSTSAMTKLNINHNVKFANKSSKYKSWLMKDSSVYGNSKGDGWFDVLSIAMEFPLTVLAPSGNALFKSEHLRTVTNMYIVSLAVSDGLVGLLLPWKITLHFLKTGRHATSDQEIGCLVLNCGFFTLMAASMLTITVISVDRFLHVRFPLRYPHFTCPRFAVKVITLKWIVAVILGAWPVINAPGLAKGFHEKMPCHAYFMQYEYREYQLFCQGGLFLVCSIVSLLTYLYICFVAIRHRREIARIAPRSACQLGQFRDDSFQAYSGDQAMTTKEDRPIPGEVSIISATCRQLIDENWLIGEAVEGPCGDHVRENDTSTFMNDLCWETDKNEGKVISRQLQVGEHEKEQLKEDPFYLNYRDRTPGSSARSVAQGRIDTTKSAGQPRVIAEVEQDISPVPETSRSTHANCMDMGVAAAIRENRQQFVGNTTVTKMPRPSFDAGDLMPTVSDTASSISKGLNRGQEGSQFIYRGHVGSTSDTIESTTQPNMFQFSSMSKPKDNIITYISGLSQTIEQVSDCSVSEQGLSPAQQLQQSSAVVPGNSHINQHPRHSDQPSTSHVLSNSLHQSNLRSTERLDRQACVARVHPNNDETLTSTGPGQQKGHSAPVGITVTLYFCVFGLFFVLWSPAFLVLLLGMYADGNLCWLRVLFPVGLLNSVCNVIVYALKSDQMRYVMKQILLKWCCRKSDDSSIVRVPPKA